MARIGGADPTFDLARAAAFRTPSLAAVPHAAAAPASAMPNLAAAGALSLHRSERHADDLMSGAYVEPQKPFSVADFMVPLSYLRLLVGDRAAEPMLSWLGMDRLLPHEAANLSSITFCNLCLEHIRATRDESLGQPQSVPFGNFALLMATVAQGADLTDALRRCANAMKILRPDLNAKVRLEQDGLRFSIESIFPRTPAIEIGLEYLFISLHCALRWLTGEKLQPRHIRASARFAGYERCLVKVLMSPTSFQGAGITVHYRLEDAALALRPVKYESWAAHEMPEYLRLLQEAADQINQGRPDQVHDLIDRIARLASTGIEEQSRVASLLGMSPSTLRRRLKEENTSYRDIIAGLRREDMSRLLLTEMPLADVAAELGFSDVRSFRRAFVRWFGISPAAFRRNPQRTR